MHSRLWTPISIGLILLSFMVFAYMARKPLCIDSRVVDKIDRVSEKGASAVAYRCSLHRSVDYDEKWNSTLNSISRRVQRVEKLLESISPFHEHVRITVLENRPRIFKIAGHELYLGEEVMNVTGPLEKAMVKIWMREFADPLLIDHPLLEESLSDLVLFAVNGNLEMQDPFLKMSPDINRSEKWPFLVKSLAGYCRSPWRQMEHLQLCSRELSESGLKETNLVPMSLRPLLTRAMIRSYLKLSGSEQKNFLESMPKNLGTLTGEQLGVGFSTSDRDQQNFVDLSFEISSLKNTLTKTFKSQTWAKYLEDEIQLQGFSDQLGEAQLDQLVVLSNVNSHQEVNELSLAAQRFPDQSMGVINQEHIYLLPGIEPIRRDIFGQIRAQKITLVTCEAPTLAEIDAFSEISNRLFVIVTCTDKTKIRYDGLFKGKIEYFAVENPSLSFVEIHLPSFHLALQKKKLNLNIKLAMNFNNPKDPFLQTLGWQQPKFEEELKAFRAHSDIEAFRLYRP